MHDWYSPEGFEFGEMYVDSEGELTLEYAGSVTARAAQGLITASADTIETSHDTELVLVFLVVDDDADAVTFYTHTKADADRGYGFSRLRIDRSTGSAVVVRGRSEGVALACSPLGLATQWMQLI